MLPLPLPAVSNRRSSRAAVSLCRGFLGVTATLLAVACADRHHEIVISVPEQRMVLLDDGVPTAFYPVSTSRFGLGDTPGSNGTPLGALEIAEKIGGGAPLGMKFKSRVPTGEIVPVDAPGRDPVVTRILWAARAGARQRQRVRSLHLHPRHARGTQRRPARQLRLHTDALARRGGALRNSRQRRARFHPGRNPGPGRGRTSRHGDQHSAGFPAPPAIVATATRLYSTVTLNVVFTLDLVTGFFAMTVIVATPVPPAA